MAKKSHKFKNDYLINLKGKLAAEQMIGEWRKKTIIRQSAQLESLQNRIANLCEREKFLCLVVSRLEKRLRELETIIPLSAI